MDERAHSEPDKWCQAPLCKDTNWGGYNRLHTRGPRCPAYDPNPEPNEIADFWEDIRSRARSNARLNPRFMNQDDITDRIAEILFTETARIVFADTGDELSKRAAAVISMSVKQLAVAVVAELNFTQE